MRDYFLIFAGGTGAKIAESFIHLCAAGLGPERAHVLLLDADTTNGNLKRTEETKNAYVEVAKWPWRAQSERNPNRRLAFFQTEIHYYTLNVQIDLVSAGGLRGAASQQPQLEQALDLLFDAQEQTDQCEEGFQARPNFGSVILGAHLAKHFAASHGGAAEFLAALAESLSPGEPIPIAAAASVFGGTGASLLPIVRGAVEKALEKKLDGPSAASKEKLRQLRWARVMMLPYFQPNDRAGAVDPRRFALDASSALQFYGAAGRTAQSDDVIYLLGSDRVPLQRTVPHVGAEKQCNPAFLHEVVAALALLDFAADPQPGPNPVRIFNFRKEAAGSSPEQRGSGLALGELPAAWHPEGAARVRENLACLLQLGGFLLRGGNESEGAFHLGLLRYLEKRSKKDIAVNRWPKRLIDPWARELNHETLNQAKGTAATLTALFGDGAAGLAREGQQCAARYFGRLLLWAATALRWPSVAEALRFEADGDYASLHHGLNDVRTGEVRFAHRDWKQSAPAAQDNPFARLCRGVMAAMLNHLDGRLSSQGFDFNPSSSEESGFVPLHLGSPDLARGLSPTLTAEEVERLCQRYREAAGLQP